MQLQCVHVVNDKNKTIVAVKKKYIKHNKSVSIGNGQFGNPNYPIFFRKDALKLMIMNHEMNKIKSYIHKIMQ